MQFGPDDDHVEALQEVRRTHGLTVQFRVGLNSGEVVVRGITNDLHMDYSAIGQTVHLAARMEQLATPGSILLTPATLRLVEGLVHVHALDPISVKGLVEPVEVKSLSRGEIAARAAGYQPYAVEIWQACEYWANRAGCGHLLGKRPSETPRASNQA